MTFLIDLQRDSANSRTNDLHLAVATLGDRVRLTLRAPERTVEISLEDFLLVTTALKALNDKGGGRE